MERCVADALERVEPAGPLRPVRLEPRAELPERLGTEPVQPVLRVPADLDQPGVAQHLEVAGHAGLVHADPLDQLAHRPLPDPDSVEDATPRWLRDCVEDGQLCVHPMNIRSDICTVQPRSVLCEVCSYSNAIRGNVEVKLSILQ